MIDTIARNANLGDLAQLLREQQARKLDLVIPASAVRAENGLLRLRGADPVVDTQGVTQVDGLYRPTRVCDDGIAGKLNIPQAYLRRLREQRPDIWDANVNGWLHGAPGDDEDEGDPRKFLLRAFRGDADDSEGIARAWLSNGYKAVDNLDTLTAALDGARQAGTDITIGRCDLTEQWMYVDVLAPGITALAPNLLTGYRNPLGGQLAGEPVIYSGLRIRNSEVGLGAASVTPMAVVQVCTNGMTVTKDRLRIVHLGGKLEEGIINWSDDTRRAQLEVVTNQCRDAVATFLHPDYLAKVVGEIEAKAGTALPKAAEKIEAIGSTLGFSAEETAGVLDHFITSGTPTAGGLANAITSFSQTLANADRANDLDDTALRALELAVTAAAE